MTFEVLSEKEIRKAERRMKTRAFQKAVEVWRKRRAAGEEPNFDAMAREMKIPVQIILAIWSRHVERETGHRLVPVGRVQ